MKTKTLILGGVVLAASLLILVAPARAQAPSPAAAAGTPAVQHKTLLERIYEGGWVMVPIVLCSVLTVYLIGDGVTRTAPNRLVPPEQTAAIKDLFRQGDYVGAYNFCKANPSAMANVVRVGVSYLGDGKHMTETAMSEELTKENSNVQTKLSYLSVIGVCTPMIGLLGTVTGMMSAFSTLGTSGIGDPSSLAGAIGEVLIATASGLFIAIPAFAFFYYLRNRAAGAMHVVEDTVNSLFRKMPYELLAGVHIGDEELFAAAPNWVQAESNVHGHEAAHVHAADIEAQTVTAQAPMV
jgi:biopolymer transport protein ExbB